MLLKIISAVLILFSAYMGFKHGWAMATADPKMLDMFGKWGVERNGIIAFGVVGLVATAMVLFPRTFFIGNFLTSASLLLIVAWCLRQRDFKTALLELPFMVLPLLLIYLKHPLAK